MNIEIVYNQIIIYSYLNKETMEKLEQHCKNNILDFNFLTNKKINPSNTTSKQLRVLCDARFDKESRSQLVHILKTEKSSKAFVRIANQILGTELEVNNISTHKVKVDMDRDVSTLRHTPTSDDRGSIASSDIPPISAPPTPPPQPPLTPQPSQSNKSPDTQWSNHMRDIDRLNTFMHDMYTKTSEHMSKTIDSHVRDRFLRAHQYAVDHRQLTYEFNEAVKDALDAKLFTSAAAEHYISQIADAEAERQEEDSVFTGPVAQFYRFVRKSKLFVGKKRDMSKCILISVPGYERPRLQFAREHPFHVISFVYSDRLLCYNVFDLYEYIIQTAMVTLAKSRDAIETHIDTKDVVGWNIRDPAYEHKNISISEYFEESVLLLIFDWYMQATTLTNCFAQIKDCQMTEITPTLMKEFKKYESYLYPKSYQEEKLQNERGSHQGMTRFARRGMALMRTLSKHLVHMYVFRGLICIAMRIFFFYKFGNVKFMAQQFKLVFKYLIGDFIFELGQSFGMWGKDVLLTSWFRSMMTSFATLTSGIPGISSLFTLISSVGSPLIQSIAEWQARTGVTLGAGWMVGKYLMYGTVGWQFLLGSTIIDLVSNSKVQQFFSGAEIGENMLRLSKKLPISINGIKWDQISTFSGLCQVIMSTDVMCRLYSMGASIIQVLTVKVGHSLGIDMYTISTAPIPFLKTCLAIQRTLSKIVKTSVAVKIGADIILDVLIMTATLSDPNGLMSKYLKSHANKNSGCIYKQSYITNMKPHPYHPQGEYKVDHDDKGGQTISAVVGAKTYTTHAKDYEMDDAALIEAELSNEISNDIGAHTHPDVTDFSFGADAKVPKINDMILFAPK